MKLRAFIMLVALLFGLSVSAKKYPEIKFEKTTIDFGTFSMDEPIQKAVFRFTNVGKAKLVINYVHASCGCTVAEYPKDYIAPGASGEITVTYNGKVLKEGTDYNVVLRNNTRAGTGTAIITGHGNYSGKRTVKYNISR